MYPRLLRWVWAPGHEGGGGGGGGRGATEAARDGYVVSPAGRVANGTGSAGTGRTGVVRGQGVLGGGGSPPRWVRRQQGPPPSGAHVAAQRRTEWKRGGGHAASLLTPSGGGRCIGDDDWWGRDGGRLWWLPLLGGRAVGGDAVLNAGGCGEWGRVGKGGVWGALSTRPPGCGRERHPPERCRFWPLLSRSDRALLSEKACASRLTRVLPVIGA